jgi:hypothetical protein
MQLWLHRGTDAINDTVADLLATGGDAWRSLTRLVVAGMLQVVEPPPGSVGLRAAVPRSVPWVCRAPKIRVRLGARRRCARESSVPSEVPGCRATSGRQLRARSRNAALAGATAHATVQALNRGCSPNVVRVTAPTPHRHLRQVIHLLVVYPPLGCRSARRGWHLRHQTARQ